MITEDELLGLGRRGYIPGPSEDEAVFLKRVLKAAPQSDHWDEAQPITLPLFGFSVDWVPIHYSNKNLPFWEGAAMWIGEDFSIQMREGFKKGSYLGYKREEVLAHEAVHAARMAFEEPKFEEVLAYRTSKNILRKWVGPLFQKPWETVVLMLSLAAAPLGYFWVPLMALGLLGIRLAWTQWILSRCLKKLPLSIVVCLTDKEIRRFSRLSLSEIETYLKNDQTLRGYFLKVKLQFKLNDVVLSSKL